MAILLLVLASTLYLLPKDTYVSVFKSAITASCTNKCPVILMNSLRRRLIPDSGFYFEPRILTVQRYPCATPSQPPCSRSLHYYHHHTSTVVALHTWWGFCSDENSDISAKLNCRLHPKVLPFTKLHFFTSSAEKEQPEGGLASRIRSTFSVSAVQSWCCQTPKAVLPRLVTCYKQRPQPARTAYKL